MNRKTPFFPVICAGLLALVVSCSVKVEGFVFRDAAGTEVPLTLASRDGWKPPGEVSPLPGKGLVFRLEKPVAIESAAGSLYLRYRDAVPGLSLSVPGPQSEVSSPLPAAAGGGETDFFLLLPPGPYGEFTIRAETAGASLRLLEAGIRASEQVVRSGPRGIYATSELFPSAEGRVLLRSARTAGDEVSLVFAADSAGRAVPGSPAVLNLSRGAERFSAELRLRPVPESVYLHSRFLGFVPEVFEISGLPAGSSWELRLLNRPEWRMDSPSFAPVPTDLGMLLEAPAEWRHRDFEVFRWNLFPDVLVFDTRNYDAQKRLFHRLAFFTEKKGYRGKLHPYPAIWNLHGWNAHNYHAEGLADFFETARKTSFRLNGEEIWLRDYLVSQGILKEAGGSYLPGTGGVLGISRESLPAHRRLLMAHEAFHGVFYGMPGFRRLAEETWKALPREQKDFWLFFFSWMNYDITDSYLMVNEFQAYLLQQGLSRVDGYFKGTIAGRLAERYPERKAWLDTLFARHPDMFTRPAGILSGYLEGSLGIRAGDVLSLRPLK